MRWISKLSIPFTLLVVTWCASNINWGKKNCGTILEADAKGYYAYLPAVFIYHDLHFSFHDTIEKKYYSGDTYYEYRTLYKGVKINKYYSGTAIAQLPFFLVAHALTFMTSYPTDGFSRLYQVFMNIAAIFYLFIGLVFMRNYLRSFQVNDNVIAFIILLIVFGTNLFYYAVSEPGMSHVYSFAFISMFAYYSRKYFITLDHTYTFYCAALLGLSFLIRPVNVLVIFTLPFAAGSFEKFREGMKAMVKQKIKFFFACSLVFGIILIQFLVYKIQTGDLFIYSYGTEGFNWFDPHPIDFLFSFRKGVFVYTPLLLFAMAGFAYLWKKERFRFYSLFIFSGVLIYVLSAWWNWWYGGSFGSRVMIDYYIFDALLIGLTYKSVEKRWARITYTTMLVLCTLLCVAQTYQYRYNIIHWENMDAAKYWNVFLDFGKILN